MIMEIDRILHMSSAVIKNSSGEVLLVRRSSNHSFPGYWQLPEGKIEKDEGAKDALIREVKEEIGVRVTLCEFVTITSLDIKRDETNYLIVRAVFRVEIDKSEIVLSSEHDEYQWVSQKNIKKLQLLPGVLDAISVL